ncbi:MAG TPA: hypothetical protein VHE81_11230, partial [Lacipirellulaceae bacterium]|nr:hypothetical protein [Lacipirellulaceae bacterium]
MNDESANTIERRLASLGSRGVPSGLRDNVLADVHRELRAARWDRRLARTAVVLLVVGIGMNAVVGLPRSDSGRSSVASIHPTEARQSLVETAVVVAQATDASTALQFARQLAAMTGRELTPDEAAAIDAAVQRHS